MFLTQQRGRRVLPIPTRAQPAALRRTPCGTAKQPSPIYSLPTRRGGSLSLKVSGTGSHSQKSGEALHCERLAREPCCVCPASRAGARQAELSAPSPRAAATHLRAPGELGDRQAQARRTRACRGSVCTQFHRRSHPHTVFPLRRIPFDFSPSWNRLIPSHERRHYCGAEARSAVPLCIHLHRPLLCEQN